MDREDKMGFKQEDKIKSHKVRHAELTALFCLGYIWSFLCNLLQEEQKEEFIERELTSLLSPIWGSQIVWNNLVS